MLDTGVADVVWSAQTFFENGEWLMVEVGRSAGVRGQETGAQPEGGKPFELRSGVNRAKRKRRLGARGLQHGGNLAWPERPTGADPDEGVGAGRRYGDWAEEGGSTKRTQFF